MRHQLISNSRAQKGTRLQVTEIIEYLTGTRFAVHVVCDDGKEYAIKGIPQVWSKRQPRRLYGRELFVEQMVGILGQLLEAPIPCVALAELNKELICAGTWVRCLAPGTCHAIRWLDNVVEVRDPRTLPLGSPANRESLANLAVLIGWISDRPSDTQFLVKQSVPNRIFSVDHGLLAGSIKIWADVKRNETLWQGYGIRPHHAMARALKVYDHQPVHEIPEIRRAARRLQQITVEQIVGSLTSQPDEWGVSVAQRVQLLKYLQIRQRKLVNYCLNGS